MGLLNSYSQKFGTRQVINPDIRAYISTSKNRLKQYEESNYYLESGTEFEIEFDNKSNTEVLCRIKLNDKYISQSGLIIGGGVHHFLERWIDENRKFIFNTFDVDDVEATEKQRERNGKVEIEFYAPVVHIRQWPVYPDNDPFYYGSPTYDTTFSDGRKLLCDANNSITPTNFSSNVSQVETGRVDKGDESDQSFTTSSSQFELSPFKTVRYQILPVSQKPQRISNVRHYCTECGMRRRKDSWNFCPQCGTKM